MLDTAIRHEYIPRSMTPDDFRAALAAKGIETQAQAAILLGVSQGHVSKWLSGTHPIPPIAAVALRAIPTVQDKAKTRNGRGRKQQTVKQ